MTKRFAHVQALVELRDCIDTYPDPKNAVHDAIVNALPKQYRTIYAWIISHGGKDITTSFVVAGWRIAPNHASSILNELWQFGLLEREMVIDDSGKRYQYSVKA